MRLAFLLLIAMMSLAATGAPAQQTGGILRVTHRDSPASMSIHEEGTNSVITPMMAVFNNLVIYDQHVKQNSLTSIVPELATSWSWNEDQTRLTFKLRDGVKWHDGQPFTAKDVECTWNKLTGKSADKFRLNFRASWYANLAEVTPSGDFEVTFHLKRPQPAFLALLAAGYSVVYPCHVPSNTMRTRPIGTGPFKLTEFKANDSIRFTRNPDYWKPGLPYLDGIEYTIIPNRSTAILAFAANKFDVTFPFEITIPLVKDVMAQAPQAICEVASANVSTNLLVNNEKPPFDNPAIRRAMALTLDRAAFIDILSEGKNDAGGAMLPPPEGIWGMPSEMLRTLPGYGADVEQNREAGRRIMRELGYGPDKRLAIKVSTRNIGPYKDPAVVLIDQLKQVYIDGELEVIDTSIWFPKVTRKDFAVALNLTGSAVDDPDQQFFENYACGATRNYNGYCNKEIDALIARQSAELDQDKRRRMVWEIDRRLQEDVARPIIFHGRSATCWHPRVKNITIMINSLYNGWRFDDVWLAKE
ncbi:MAG: peptide ABC transporter substrate-binding protein [Acetobacteraceae bacterium]|nr:peptide ABC transporter substrate-binding protein [Acetobacteraceae bacterium]